MKPLSDIQKRFFWSRFKKVNDCLLWTGNKGTEGYGLVWFEKHRYTHRLAWELRHGEIKNALWVLHSLDCLNKNCAADKHLRLGTPKENAIDRVWAGTCKSPLRFGESNGKSKLTETQVYILRIMREPKRGGFKKLAKIWNVGHDYLSKVKQGRGWPLVALGHTPPSKSRTNRKNNTSKNPHS